MTMLLFTELSGLGVVFLMYVLVQFWKDGHRAVEQPTSGRVIEFSLKSNPTVVVNHSISERAHAGLSVVSMRARTSGTPESQLHRVSTDQAREMSMNCFPGSPAWRGMKRN